MLLSCLIIETSNVVIVICWVFFNKGKSCKFGVLFVGLGSEYAKTRVRFSSILEYLSGVCLSICKIVLEGFDHLVHAFDNPKKTQHWVFCFCFNYLRGEIELNVAAWWCRMIYARTRHSGRNSMKCVQK